MQVADESSFETVVGISMEQLEKIDDLSHHRKRVDFCKTKMNC
jgi:hypothetical protein